VYLPPGASTTVLPFGTAHNGTQKKPAHRGRIIISFSGCSVNNFFEFYPLFSKISAFSFAEREKSAAWEKFALGGGTDFPPIK